MSGGRICARRFLGDEAGAATIDYVLLLLPLLALVFFSFQIALAYHFALTAQKAVELGARVAAVRDPVHAALPRTNRIAPGRALGDACALGGCLAPEGGPWICVGDDLKEGDCDAAAYGRIFDEVARVAYLLDPGDLSVTYSYAELGFAGGPFTPIVEVSIRERPFLLQFFFNLAFTSGENESSELNLPAVAAAAVAEDMSSEN
ncbi:MAG: TadE/TadG family type IV pilus assembly protein [Pikeienuella sp.]